MEITRETGKHFRHKKIFDRYNELLQDKTINFDPRYTSKRKIYDMIAEEQGWSLDLISRVVRKFLKEKCK